MRERKSTSDEDPGDPAARVWPVKQIPCQGSFVMRLGGGLTGLSTENPSQNPDSEHVFKQDEKIAKYPVHPGCSVAVADAGSGNRLQGSSETISEDDISQNPHFLPKNSFIFQEHTFFDVDSFAADGKTLLSNVPTSILIIERSLS